MYEISYMAVAFFVSSFLISLTCLLYSLIQGRQDKLHKKLYLWMLGVLLLNAVTETVATFVTPFRLESELAFFTMTACNYLYFLAHTMLLLLLGYYVLAVTGELHRFTTPQYILFPLPVVVIETLFTTNPFHFWCYGYDEVTRAYERGTGVTLLYFVSAGYLIFCAITFFRSWRAITPKRRYALAYFIGITVVGMLLQAFIMALRVELFADSLACLGLMLTVEDERDLIDNDTGVYNRRALRIDWDTLAASRQSFHVLCIKIENPGIIRRTTGLSEPVVLADLLLDQLVRYLPRCLIYQTAPDTFVMTLLRQDHAAALTMANHISERFEKSWHCANAEIILKATVMLARVPEDIDSAEKLFDMADSALPHLHNVRLYGKDSLAYLLRRRAVENAIQRGLDQGGFEVYYQPTFFTDGLKIKGAEALLRLHDTVLGNIFPDEFIPIAEETGLIGQVDDFVLQSVCRFVASGTPRQLGIDSINVNLSVQQCVQPGFVEHIVALVNESGADRSQISFEITESVEASDYGILDSVIQQLKQQGFQVYMDDYGTGYSNVRALFAMGFDIIKIDKSILWGAEKSEMGHIILTNNVRMLKQMHLGVLVEGVETKEQIDLLTQLGVDYLQGFYFSRPVPEKELVALLQTTA